MKASTPLKRGYLVKSKLLNFLLLAIDKALLLACHFTKQRKNFAIDGSNIKRILFCNNAHLGDVIIATSIVRLVKKYYPNMEIGFLAGSWAKKILDKHSLIDRVYYLDHWHLNRSKISLVSKLLLHMKTARRAVSEIRRGNYDVAIDLYPFFENSIFLLWCTKIPIRVGYASGGLGSLLTHPQTWNLEEKHIAYYHIDLVRVIFQEFPQFPQLRPIIPQNPQVNLDGLLSKYFIKNGYVVCHPGSGSALRNWPLDKWMKLRELLVSSGNCLVFTGLGHSEAKDINTIIGDDFTNCINLCDQLSWYEFVEIIARAKCLIGVDSSASHVAAAVGISSVIICGGMVNFKHWQPLTKKTKILYNDVDCLPCYNGRGCKNMRCIRELDAAIVCRAVLSTL